MVVGGRQRCATRASCSRLGQQRRRGDEAGLEKVGREGREGEGTDHPSSRLATATATAREGRHEACFPVFLFTPRFGRLQYVLWKEEEETFHPRRKGR